MKLKKPMKIADIIDIDWYTGTPSVNYNFTYDSNLFKDSQGDPIAFDIFPDTKTFLDILLYDYSERYVFITDDESHTDYNLELYFLIQEFYNEIGSQLADIVGSIEISYDPTHNYDGVESTTRSHDTTYGKTTTATDSFTDYKEVTEGQYYGIDGTASPADVDKSTHSLEGTKTNSVQDMGTDKISENVTTTKGGNLGLTTNAQLIEGDRKLRMKNIYKSFVRLFVDDMTFYM